MGRITNCLGKTGRASMQLVRGGNIHTSSGKDAKTFHNRYNKKDQIKELLGTVKKSDCVILMGDLNCELQRHQKGCTGKWCMNTRKDNGHGEEILTLMRSFDLFAVDTLFKPERKV